MQRPWVTHGDLGRMVTLAMSRPRTTMLGVGVIAMMFLIETGDLCFYLFYAIYTETKPL